MARIRPHALARRRYDAPPTLRSAQLEGVVGAEKTHARAEEAARRLGDTFLRVQAALTDLEALTKELARVDGRRRGR